MQRSSQSLSHPNAVFLALLTCLLLTSTLVILKIALEIFPPFTLAVLRYGLGFLTMAPILAIRATALAQPREVWRDLLLIGVLFHSFGNGALYIGLQFVSPTAASLLLGFVPVIVLFFGILLLREKPSPVQISGILLALAGAAVFFSGGLMFGEAKGIAIICAGLFGNASFSLLGRRVARRGNVDPVILTAVPLFVGAITLLPFALMLEGRSHLSLEGAALLTLLATFNTPLVYWLYNRALASMKAFEISTILNLAPLFTAVWSWVIVAERLVTSQFLGIGLAILGITLVLKKKA
jgi:drug/metabolite transporter (DMT)-like permease